MLNSGGISGIEAVALQKSVLPRISCFEFENMFLHILHFYIFAYCRWAAKVHQAAKLLGDFMLPKDFRGFVATVSVDV